MSQFMKTTGGRYGMHSGSGKFKNMEIVNRLNVAGNEMPIMPMNGDVFYVDLNVTASGDGRSWKFAFKTVTEGLAALKDYDTLIIGPGYYNETLKMTLTTLESVRIFGCGTGMQWNEGGTMIGDETSTDDILDITTCKGVEIAGIMFYNVTSEKDAINFTGLNYSTHIHDCSFIGDVGGGTVQEIGINCAAANGPDTYIHDCRFFRCEANGIIMGEQRCVVKNNFFVVPASGIGITNGEIAAGYNLIADNYFLGANSSDVGITVTGTGAGYAMYTHNWFANLSSEIATSMDENCLENYFADYSTGGGVVAVCDPEA